MKVEQDVDLGVKNLKLTFLGQLYDKMLLTKDRRYKNYKANEDRIIFKPGLLFEKYYGETANVKYYPVLIRKQLVDEVLRILYGEYGRHPGITRRIFA